MTPAELDEGKRLVACHDPMTGVGLVELQTWLTHNATRLLAAEERAQRAEAELAQVREKSSVLFQVFRNRSALVRHDPCIAVYTYTTPWGPGHVFFWRLSCLWPTLRFAVSYDEEFPSRGRFVASEGKVIRFDDTDSPDFTEEQQNADEEGCHDAWKKWRGELVATHDAWVADGSSMPEVSP